MRTSEVIVLNRIASAQQVGQRDAPPLGGFETQFFIKVRWLRLSLVSGAPLTIAFGPELFKSTVQTQNVVEIDNTTSVVIIYSMKATEIFRRRIVYTEISFAEIVLWKVPIPLLGSSHSYKYRLAYVVNGVCVLRYDNEAGKGDHRHFGKIEEDYKFTGPEALILDFQQDIARWNHENSNS